jgi:hypothetical protein
LRLTIEAVDDLEVFRLAVRDALGTKNVVPLDPLAHQFADTLLAPSLVELAIDVVLRWDEVGPVAFAW